MKLTTVLITSAIIVTGCSHVLAESTSPAEINKQIVVNFYTKAFIEQRPREAAELYISEET